MLVMWTKRKFRARDISQSRCNDKAMYWRLINWITKEVAYRFCEALLMHCNFLVWRWRDLRDEITQFSSRKGILLSSGNLNCKFFLNREKKREKNERNLNFLRESSLFKAKYLIQISKPEESPFAFDRAFDNKKTN